MWQHSPHLSHIACFSKIVQPYSYTSPLNVLSFQLVIAALKCHKYDKSIQVTGSAALYYLTNTEYRSDQSVRLRREVIQVVLNGMEQYQEVTVSLFCALRWTRFLCGCNAWILSIFKQVSFVAVTLTVKLMRHEILWWNRYLVWVIFFIQVQMSTECNSSIYAFVRTPSQHTHAHSPHTATSQQHNGQSAHACCLLNRKIFYC